MLIRESERGRISLETIGKKWFGRGKKSGVGEYRRRKGRGKKIAAGKSEA